MKRSIKHTSSIYSFLESSGVLEHGSHEEIDAVRKLYWKNYRANWRKQKRKECYEFTVAFTKEDMKQLNPAVKKNKMSFPKFIRQSTLGYLQHTYVTIDPDQTSEIQSLLTQNFTMLQTIEESATHPQRETELSSQFAKLEKQILTILHNPHSLEDAIKHALKKTPELKSSLITIIQNCRP